MTRLPAAVLAGLVLAACGDSVTTSKGNEDMKLTGNIKTICVGRYLIDVPAEATIEQAITEYGFGRITLIPGVLTEAEFSSYVDRNDATLLAQKNYKGNPWLVKAEKVRADLRITTSFDDESGIGHAYNAFVLNAPRMFQISAGGSEDRDYDEFKREVLAFEPRLKPLAPGSNPPEPGLCLQGAYIAGKDERGESTGVIITFPSHPDIHVTMRMQYNGKTTDSGVLDRERDIVKEMGPMMDKLRTVRKGAVTVNGDSGQEWSVFVPNDRYGGHQYLVEVPGKPNSFQYQRIELELKSRTFDTEDIKPLTTEAQALAIWDSILKSIRFRPGAV